MDIFISWSKDRSFQLAQALKAWMPRVIQSLKPWFSDVDLAPGTAWASHTRQVLNHSTFGIVCITPENVDQPWLNFEAGALSAALHNNVCPVLLGFDKISQLPTPLSIFQAVLADEAGLLKLMKTINSQLGSNALEQSFLEESFKTFWPKLNDEILSIYATPSPEKAAIEVKKDAQIIHMDAFVAAEGGLEEGDCVMLFSNNLSYDRRYFIDVIANNLNKGVEYRYLTSGIEADRNWHLFMNDLQAKGVAQLPKRKVCKVAPLIWTTAIYEYVDPNKRFDAISILEHRYESEICVLVSHEIAQLMRTQFLQYWDKAEPAG